MKIKVLTQDFSVCKLKDLSEVNYLDEFCFIGKTDEEISLVCSTKLRPDNIVECDNGWKAFRIEGVLNFSLVGILAKISTLMAENEIGIFAISTYNTDYILVKKSNLEKAVEILKHSGYEIKEEY